MAVNDVLRSTLCEFVDYAAEAGLIGWADRVWAYNTILEAIGATGPAPVESWVLDERFAPLLMTPAGRHSETCADEACAVDDAEDDKTASSEETVLPDSYDDAADFDLEGHLSVLAEEAVKNGVVEETTSGRDRAAMRIAGVVTPHPSEVAEWFEDLYAESPRDATDWFYQMCCDVNYVRRAAIARNIVWTTPTCWGNLQITINRSKPEKDPRDIAAAGCAQASEDKYPACQLCVENEGHPGRSAAGVGGAHPARQNLRIVPLQLAGERFGLQYSPYAYFNEHCIVMSAHHRSMHIDRASLACLIDFVDILPHYFIGSNADLPIVGGSILSNDHFQGGNHVFPMMSARAATAFKMAAFPEVEAVVLQWPLSVLRLRGKNRTQMLNACVHVVDTWRTWTDEAAGVIAHDADGTPHNTVTPVIRRVDEEGQPGGDIYEAYLALRCNITSDKHPLGVFHPHEEWHHIKKENIGLIEVMGLAILPPRLIDEQAGGNAEALPKDYIGEVFGHVLEDAGVFKWDEEGRLAQQRFIEAL